MYENDVYVRSNDAAAFLGVCKLTLLRMIHNGEFESVRLEETYGHRGGRAYEIAKSELVAKKAERLAKKMGKKIPVEPIVEEKPVATTNKEDEAKRKAEVRMALHNLQECIKLLSGCIEDLVETMI